MKTSNKYLRQARKDAGLSQVELAKALGFSTPQYISNIERGHGQLPIVHVKKVCAVLGIDPERLISSMCKDYEAKIRDEISK